MLGLGLERLSWASRPRALGCLAPWSGLLIPGGQRGGWVAECVQSWQRCRLGDRPAWEPADHLVIGGPKAALAGDPMRTGLFQANFCVSREAGFDVCVFVDETWHHLLKRPFLPPLKYLGNFV